MYVMIIHYIDDDDDDGGGGDDDGVITSIPTMTSRGICSSSIVVFCLFNRWMD